MRAVVRAVVRAVAAAGAGAAAEGPAAAGGAAAAAEGASAGGAGPDPGVSSPAKRSGSSETTTRFHGCTPTTRPPSIRTLASAPP